MMLSISAMVTAEPYLNPGLHVAQSGYVDHLWRSTRAYFIPDGDGFAILNLFWKNSSDGLSLETGIIVDEYDSSYKFVRRHDIPCELTVFNSYLQGSDGYHYILVTQGTKDPSAEVARLIRYDKNWQRVSAVSLPSGMLDSIGMGHGTGMMADDGEILVIHGERGMYSGHQANYTVFIDLKDMSIISVPSWTRVGHSFAQFTAFDGDKVIFVDHGDANPRAERLLIAPKQKMNNPSEVATTIDLMTFTGASGNNYTGAATSGLGISATHYLVVGHSVDQTNKSSDGTRNIRLSAIPKNNPQNYKTAWLTDLPVNMSTIIPYIAALPNDIFAIIWEEFTSQSSSFPFNDVGNLTEDILSAAQDYGKYTATKYLLVDSQGNPQGQPVVMEGVRISDKCRPVYWKGNLNWITTSGFDKDDYTIYCYPMDGSEKAVVLDYHARHNPVLATQPITTSLPAEKITQPAHENNVTIQQPITLVIDSLRVIRGDEQLPEPPLAPQLIGGRTMLPFRYLVQNVLGGEVDYNADTRTITARLSGKTFHMTVDVPVIYVNGEPYDYGQAPVTINGSTLVPLRAFEHVLQDLKWDASTQTVSIIP